MINWNPTEEEMGIDPEIEEIEDAFGKAGWSVIHKIGNDYDDKYIEVKQKGELFLVDVWNDDGQLFCVITDEVPEMLKIVKDVNEFLFQKEEEVSFIQATGWEAVYVNKDGQAFNTLPVVLWGYKGEEVEGYVTASRPSSARHVRSGFPIARSIDPVGQMWFGEGSNQSRFSHYQQVD